MSCVSLFLSVVYASCRTFAQNTISFTSSSFTNDKVFFSISELDDGAYNPLWTTKGFTQTFHFWKENRRQQSTPLNAFLTYVTLPWWSIAKGKTIFSKEGQRGYSNQSKLTAAFLSLQIYWTTESNQY